MTTKILVLASNPQGTEQLHLNLEIQKIDGTLERAKNREKFVLRSKVAVRVEDLQRSLCREETRIVHFCGHGIGSKGLVLQTDLGQQQFLDNQAIALPLIGLRIGVNLSGADLSGTDLSETLFEDANLSGANLSNVAFHQSGFVRTNLRNTNLSRADFYHASLFSTDLTDASLVNARLKSADFTGNILTRTNLTGVDFKGASVGGNIYLDTIMPDGTIRTDSHEF